MLNFTVKLVLVAARLRYFLLATFLNLGIRPLLLRLFSSACRWDSTGFLPEWSTL